MTNRSKSRGTAWESAVVTYLQARGWPHAERRALHGALDCGDIAGIVGVVIECQSAAKVELAAWLDEAKAEGLNARADLAAAWFKRRGKTSPGGGFVVMDGETFTWLLKEAGY